MATYECLKEETRNIGKNSYVEVARKRLREVDGTTEYILVSRGFFDKDGTKKWTRFVTIPAEPEVTDWVAEALTRV